MAKIIALILCALIQAEYEGIRIARKCNSVLKDSLYYSQGIEEELKKAEIGDVSTSEGDWWNRRSLRLTNIKATDFVFSKDKLTLNNCQILPTGILQADFTGEALEWKVEFTWKYQLLFLTFSGTGKAKFQSNSIEFLQSYRQEKADTNLYIRWNIQEFDISGTFASTTIKNWAHCLTQEKMIPHINLVLNLNLGNINNNIISKYKEFQLLYNSFKVIVENRISISTNAEVNKEPYILLNYGGLLYVPGKEVSQTLNNPIRSDVALADGSPFDFQICYNPSLFSALLQTLLKAGHYQRLINEPEKNGLPNKVRYYKAIIPKLGEIYVDSTRVKIMCDKASWGEVEIKKINRMRIPYTCLFSILESDYQFLNLTMVMDAQYDLKMNEEKKIFGALSKMTIHSVESVPKVQMQARVLTFELANKLSFIFDGQQLGLPTGLTLDFPRADQFDFIRFDSSNRNDTCLIYKEK